jgi:hypothetical protein
MWENPKRVDRAIKQLTKEIDEIEAAIYSRGEDRPVLVAGMLERKRNDIVRSAVLQLHTSIEDLITSLILYCVLDITDKKLKHRLASAVACHFADPGHCSGARYERAAKNRSGHRAF